MEDKIVHLCVVYGFEYTHLFLGCFRYLENTIVLISFLIVIAIQKDDIH